MAEPTAIPNIDIPHDAIAMFCEKWGVSELALFGSVLRDDFTPDSDIDVLVTFAPEARRGLFVLVEMQAELAKIFGKRVDLGTRDSVERDTNPYRREGILRDVQVIYGS
ncbi:MAG: nucleotidyltransferase family protein [Chloroflexi bacterium]|nr:nucleotidyltransferase family protein [Chloroflexota bacterium]